MAKFNVLDHNLVPEHHIVPEEEEKNILKELNIEKEFLPKISPNDPAIKALEAVHGKIKEGTIIKIVRKSPTMGHSVYYRVVASEVFK
ncbi:DNA-directed RNA polymerase subunit H [Thermoplasma acidophilum]|uniref:DNA-directed RNA polymerase subunit Rpo5 n=1 Tax=Thermoplasma acidophilum (strain ATCC 25905 / DSM 1728 / JCM 9062 / NBRC 15155 / AMRC-C165) TaxID=273075 RepID=RPO5_THEAC|nr:DNA-directed RNA polymerase subunit H [Thermoplasma acidophilum]Q03588.1 RecName: Full=DNA-directed RNA polymerase subunit Rpo5; AltName: Full=DNA-directed RNA polymerase subunit H [Thermoplasma acidophilum DSM 1728]MCY0851307.1 DNA-directed RNA polymerase subunit H [Thermoplasma acidophilum]CAA48279.1 DNA-directed RNA polymerase [Thermoplasma acidophilum]